MTPYVSSAHIADGRLVVRNRRQWDAVVQRAKPGEYTLTLERVRATRSPAQNAYYWSVVVKLISEETGYTLRETHEILKARFLPRDLAERGVNGRLVQGLVLGGHTSRLDTIQFTDYLDAIVRWAAETMHLVIPDPYPEWRASADQARARARQALTDIPLQETLTCSQ